MKGNKNDLHYVSVSGMKVSFAYSQKMYLVEISQLLFNDYIH